MEMYMNYIRASQNSIWKAEETIFVDKFHVRQHLGDAVDKVRRQEHRSLLEQDDHTLTGSKYTWLQNPWNMGTKAGLLEAFEGHRAEDWAGMGVEGERDEPMAVRLPHMGAEGMEGLDLLGDALTPRAHESCRANGAQTLVRDSQCDCPGCDERTSGVDQLEDPAGETHGLRLPQP